MCSNCNCVCGEICQPPPNTLNVVCAVLLYSSVSVSSLALPLSPSLPLTLSLSLSLSHSLSYIHTLSLSPSLSLSLPFCTHIHHMFCVLPYLLPLLLVVTVVTSCINDVSFSHCPIFTIIYSLYQPIEYHCKLTNLHVTNSVYTHTLGALYELNEQDE